VSALLGRTRSQPWELDPSATRVSQIQVSTLCVRIECKLVKDIQLSTL